MNVSFTHGAHWMRAALLISSLACASSAQGAVVDATAVHRVWEHERSDVAPDPRVHFGQLPNGLRWAWAANVEPDQRAYLRLHIDAGSLAEAEEERGMAHFLEHMGFNGTEHYPPGTLIEWFQAHGMAFGPDTNAHTGFGETVYEIDLPKAEPEALREGLEILRDYASGMQFATEEVDAEKGVIDAEERERDSAGMRVFLSMIDNLVAGTRLTERIPIGVKAKRDAFTQDSLRAFYAKWYRPENATLIGVGDFGDLSPEELFEEAFGDWVPHATAAKKPAPEPPTGEPRGAARFFAVHEEEIPSVTIQVQRLRPWKDEPFTRATLVRELPLEVAHGIINLRFAELSTEESTPVLGAGMSSEDFFQIYDVESLGVACEPDRWEEALAFAERELRRAIEHGFEQAELDEVRANSLRSLDEAVEREATQHSLGLVGELLLAAEERHVPTDASTKREILGPAIEALTVEACQKALAQRWKEGELAIFSIGSLDLGADAEQKLRAAYEASRAVEVEAREEGEEVPFAYASEKGDLPEVLDRQVIEDFDTTTVRFANGVAINLKRTDFKEKQILMRAVLGEGRLSSPNEASAVRMVAGGVFIPGALGAHDDDELRRLNAGRVLGTAFGAGEDHFVLGGQAAPEDLLRQCEMMCAYLTDPGWRDDGLVEFRRGIATHYEGLASQPNGPYLEHFQPALYHSDPRFVYPTQSEVESVEMDAIEAWLAPQLADGPLEITLVGDIDVDATLEIVARTFGRLPARRDLRAYEERRAIPAAATGLRQTHSIESRIPKTLVLLMFPTTDSIDATTRRSLSFLGEVVSDRLRVEIREKLGAAYSPGASASGSRVHPGHGQLMMQMMAEPAQAEAAVEACLAVAQALADGGVTEEEIERLREPVLTRLRDQKRTNGYWLGVLDEIQRRPESLEDIRSIDAFYANLTPETLNALASEYLPAERASVLVVHPQEGAEGVVSEASSPVPGAPAGDKSGSGDDD